MCRNRGKRALSSERSVFARVHSVPCTVRSFVADIDISKGLRSFKIQNPKSKLSLFYALFLTFTLSLDSATLSLTLSPKKPYVGEPVIATLTLKDTQALIRMRINDPDSTPQLRIERLEVDRRFSRPDDRTRRRVYRLLPLQAGRLSLPGFRADVGRYDPATQTFVWQTLSLPSRTLDVRPLPAGIPLAGDLTMRLLREENGTLEAGAPLHLTLEVGGRGDLELLPPLGWKRSDLPLYADRPRIDREFNGSAYREIWRRRFVIAPERSTVLPPLKLRVLNPSTGLVETLSTPSLKIGVRARPLPPGRVLIPILTFLLGLFVGAGALLMYLYRRRKSSPRIRNIRNIRSDRELYRTLLPYARHPEISPYIQKLEANLYRNGNHRINRRELCHLLQTLRSEKEKG